MNRSSAARSDARKVWTMSAWYVPPSGMSAGEPFLALGFVSAMGQAGTCGPAQWGYTVATKVNEALESWTFPKTVTFAMPGDGDDWKGLTWGLALVHHPGDDKVRIYGALQQGFRKDAVLAVAAPSLDLVDPTRWLYSYAPGTPGSCSGPSCAPGTTACGATPCFQAIPPATATRIDQLHHVAHKVYNDFSVDYVCHNEPAGAGGGAVNACADKRGRASRAAST